MSEDVDVMVAFRGIADRNGRRRPGGVASGMRLAAAETGARLLSFAEKDPDNDRRLDCIIRQDLLHTEWVTDLSADMIAAGYYAANTTFWPECHGQGKYVRDILGIEPDGRSSRWDRRWEMYLVLNRVMTEQVVTAGAKARRLRVITHDYQLSRMPRQIRKRRPDAQICHFVHTPWHMEMESPVIGFLDQFAVGLTAADAVGFHTPVWQDDYVAHLENRFGDRYYIDRSGHNPVVRRFNSNRTTLLFVQPIGIDTVLWPELAENPLDFQLPQDVFVWLSVERCDHTKGILERFRMIRRFFELYPEMRRRVTWVQIAEPSRENIPAFQRYKELLEREAADLTTPDETGWAPLVWQKKGLDQERLAPVYRAAHGICCTQWIDGWGMVYAEALAAQRPGSAPATVLSRKAGCAHILGESAVEVIDSPADIDAMAHAHKRAMDAPENLRREKLARSQQIINANPLTNWARRLFTGLEEAVELRQLVQASSGSRS